MWDFFIYTCNFWGGVCYKEDRNKQLKKYVGIGGIMKKIAIIFLLFAICFGCNSNNVEDDIVNEDNSIWIINQYQPLSYDEYYSKERETEIINYQLLQAKDSSLDVYYSSDDNGLFVTAFEKTA